HGGDQGADVGVAQLRLGLALELGVGKLHGDDAGQALPAVVAGDLVLPLDDVGLFAVVVQHGGESPLEALLVHAALRGPHVVGEGDDGLVVAVAVLHGDLHRGVVLLPPHVDHPVVDGGFGAVEPVHVLPDAAVVAHLVGLLLSGAVVVGGDLQPGGGRMCVV